MKTRFILNSFEVMCDNTPGGRLGLKHARMCVSKSEGNGFFFGELCRGSLQYGYVLQLKVSFKMGLFSDTKHTHLGIFILESPPRG